MPVSGPTIEMVPPYAHWHVAPMLSAGSSSISIVDGVTHGAGIIGRHAAGAPSAATTVGLAGELHSGNGGMFVIGTMSTIVPTITPGGDITVEAGTTSVLGPRPRSHISIEPVPASIPMASLSH